MPTTSPRKPVIAQVLHRLYLAGAEVLAADLARRLRDRYDFVFLCLDEVGPLGEALRAEGFPVIDLERRPGVDLGVIRRMRRALRQQRVDLVQAHQYTPFFYAAAARYVSAHPPVLFTEHGRHYPDYRRPKRVLANKFLLRRRDRVTAVGQWTKDCLIAHEGLPGHRIEVIYNGIDPQKFAMPTVARRQALRAQFGLAEGQQAILQVARFHPVKDHETSLRAFAEVRRQVRAQALPLDPVLLLAGDGEQRGRMEMLAQELDIQNQVRFLGVRKDIADLAAAADVFVLSSLSEAVSVTLLEAMATGLPIVATAVGGNPEVVADGQTGLLAPRQNWRTLAGHLLTLLRDPMLRQRLGVAGRLRVGKMFTQETMHARYEQIFAQMLQVPADDSRGK